MKTILVVDDDADIRKLWEIILSKQGYAVLQAEDGTMALDIAKEKRPDLIITDVMMENVNGFMLYELLREEPALQNTPIIFVTGVAQRAGAWDSEPNVAYLLKPVEPDDLLAAVKKKLG